MPKATNERLRAARLRTLSPSGSNEPMSRQELADQGNAVLAPDYPAEATMDANYIGKLECGKHRWPSRPRRWALRQVLHADNDAALGFFIIRGPRKAGEHSSDAPALTQHDPLPALFSVDGDRRDLLKAIAAVAAGSGLFAGPAPARRRIGAGDIARIDAVTTLYRSLDYECGGGALCDEVGRFAEAASALLAGADAGNQHSDLAGAVAAARQLAGWTAFDAGRHSDAGRHWLSAERAALTAGDLRLAARIRYCQARQFQHLAHNQDALETLRLARTQLADQATPALLTMLYGAEAASLAALGDYRAAIDTLGQASGYFGHIRPDREPGWMRFYDRGELLAQYGRVYRDLARTDPVNHADAAVEWTQQAIGAFGPLNVRSAVLNEVGLCSALTLAGEPDRAIEVGAVVIGHSRQLTSRRVQDRIRNLARDIPAETRHSGLADFRREAIQIELAAA